MLTLSRVAKDTAHYVLAATSGGDLRYLPFLPTAQITMEHAAAKAAGWSPILERYCDLIHDLDADGRLARNLARYSTEAAE